MSPRPTVADPVRVALLEDGAYYDYLLDAIRTAKRSIWAHVFSLNLRPPDDGALLVRTIARALGEARARGVDVRILLGGSATRFLTLPAGNLLAQRFLAGLGVACRLYDGEQARQSHAKFVIVDGVRLVCGSHNWSPRALAAGVDTSVVVESRPMAVAARRSFVEAWKQGRRSAFDGKEIVAGVPFARVLCDPGIYDRFRTIPSRESPVMHEGEARRLLDAEYYDAVRAAIQAARRSLRASMFFFSNPTNQRHPNYALIGDLLRAHARGVDIRILLDLDRKTDIYGSHRINRRVKDYLAGKGIRVRFDAPESVNHSKLLVADGERVLIGSHNWTAASFRYQHDVSVEIHSKALAAACMGRVDRHF